MSFSVLCSRRTGHSRVPLYLNHKANVVGMLLIKQLVLIDPDDEIPVEKNTRKDRKGDEAREIGQQLSLHEWSRRIFLPHLFLTATVPLHFPSFDVDIVQIRAMFNKKKKTHKIGRAHV